MLFYQLMYPYLPYARFFHFNPPSPQNFCCRGVCEHPLPYKESPFFYSRERYLLWRLQPVTLTHTCILSPHAWNYADIARQTPRHISKLRYLSTHVSFQSPTNFNTFMEHFEVIIFKKISWRNHLNFKVKFLSRINLPLWGFQKYEITLAKAAWNVQFQLFEKLLHANYRKQSCISRIFFKHSCISRTPNF